MAKLNMVKKARRAIPEAGIAVGDQYYWFKKRVNGKGTPRVCSKIKPRRSLYATSSPFLGALMDMEDECRSRASWSSKEEVATWLEVTANEVDALGGDCREKAASVEQGMKNGAGEATAGVLIARADHCSDLAAAIREAAGDLSRDVEVLSEDGGEEESSSGTLVADAISGLVWLPA